MATLLEDIVAAKRREVAERKARVPLAILEERVATCPAPLDFLHALQGDGVRLIAEVKKASPSRGLLRADLDPVSLACTYAENGAAAVSVLTDSHFEGCLEHLAAVKKALLPLHVPVLRKDFILEPYQVFESRAYGADAILLIVAILQREEFSRLLALSTELGMGCLVEVHDEEELTVALEGGAGIIGINNRDLWTFKTDLSVTERLAPRVPRCKTIVSESGITDREDVARVQRAGAHAVLVGEALVTAEDVAARVRGLYCPQRWVGSEVRDGANQVVRVKICGTRDLAGALAAARAGADYVGFVFVPGVRRRVEVERARSIISALREQALSLRPKTVGLFADQPLEEVNRIAEACGLDMVQLCGGESLNYCAQVERSVLKMFHVEAEAARDKLVRELHRTMDAFQRAGHLAVLDRAAAGAPGGTGLTFDWSIARELARRGHRFFLAGGLTSENVAVAIREVQPWGVDVSTGVETGGVQDAVKIERFIRNAREANRERDVG